MTNNKPANATSTVSSSSKREIEILDSEDELDEINEEFYSLAPTKASRRSFVTPSNRNPIHNDNGNASFESSISTISTQESSQQSSCYESSRIIKSKYFQSDRGNKNTNSNPTEGFDYGIEESIPLVTPTSTADERQSQARGGCDGLDSDSDSNDCMIIENPKGAHDRMESSSCSSSYTRATTATGSSPQSILSRYQSRDSSFSSEKPRVTTNFRSTKRKPSSLQSSFMKAQSQGSRARFSAPNTRTNTTPTIGGKKRKGDGGHNSAKLATSMKRGNTIHSFFKPLKSKNKDIPL